MTTTVSPAPIETIASGCSDASCPPIAHECRGDQVNAVDGEAGAFNRVDDPAHEVDVRGGHEDPAHLLALGRGVVGEDLGREDRLVRREGNDLLRLKADRVLHLGVRYEREIDLSGDRTKSCDADDHRGATEVAVRPQPRDGFGDRRTVADLTLDEGPGGQTYLTVSDEDWTGLVDVEFGGPHRAGADVEADRQLCHGDAPSHWEHPTR